MGKVSLVLNNEWNKISIHVIYIRYRSQKEEDRRQREIKGEKRKGKEEKGSSMSREQLGKKDGKGKERTVYAQ